MSYVTHKIYDGEGGAVASDEVALPVNHVSDLTIQVEGLASDTLTPQATLDGSNWYTIEGFELGAKGTAKTSITADGIYRFDVTGIAAFRLSKAGTADTVDVFAKVAVAV